MRDLFTESVHFQTSSMRLSTCSDLFTEVPTNMSTQAPTFTQPLQSVVALEGSAATFEAHVSVETVPPSFLQRLQSSTVRQGSEVRLDVRIAGIPTPVLKFYREGAEIQSSSDFRIIQEGDLYSLLIDEAFPEDSGTYSVTATNSSGRATSTAELLVQEDGR
ncbi:hypothetical protein PAMP_004259 [Pampus punctatissimus]